MRIHSPPVPPEIWGHPPRGHVLVLAPHPDDESLGCGGVIALHRSQGDPVRIVFLTDGAAGDPAGYYPADRYVAIRRGEARRAGAVLGADDLAFWDLPDGKLAAMPDLGERVAGAIHAGRPDVLYYPSSGEMHPDHWAAGAAVEALGRAGQLPCPAYAYEVWATIRPTHLIDITAVLPRKQAAMAAYPSQLCYHDYRTRILGLNAYRALLLGPKVGHAEAFQRLT